MRYFAILLLLFTMVCGYCAYDAYRFLNTPADLPGVDVHLEVERGATFDRVVWDLKKAGLITDVKRFQLFGRYKKALGSIKAGEYILNTSFTPPQVLEQLLKGQAHLVRLTLREGLPWWETAKSIEKQGFATFEHFKEVIHDPDFLARHAIPFDNAEGFLFPDTYLLNKPKQLDREQAEYIASLLVRTFWKKNTPFWQLLDASPAPSADFGADVNDITSKTKVNSLPELAHYSYQVVMRAPLPQAEEFEAAYGSPGIILEDLTQEGDITPSTGDVFVATGPSTVAPETPPNVISPAEESHKIAALQTSTTSVAQTDKPSRTSGATRAKNSAPGATDAPPAPEGTQKEIISAEKNTSAAEQATTNTPSSLPTQEEPAKNKGSEPPHGKGQSSDNQPPENKDTDAPYSGLPGTDTQGTGTPNTGSRTARETSPTTVSNSPAPSGKISGDEKTAATGTGHPQSKAEAGQENMAAGQTPSGKPDTPATSAKGKGHSNPGQQGNSASLAGGTQESTHLKTGGTATPQRDSDKKHMPSEDTSDGKPAVMSPANSAEKDSSKATGLAAETSVPPVALPDIWPAGALPKAMPKHPPKTPSEIDKKALRQALTLASLVEKETGLPTERPRVAGVYTNRIMKNMLLQCDPTIIYGIGPDFSGPIRRSQLRDASNLYNTYIHPGLPPSPICSFGVDAFASALLPEKHDYLYFVATGRGKDHTFSKTLREHNRAVSVYRARVRNR